MRQYRHVSSCDQEVQGRQGPLLLEPRRERRRQASRVPAAGALPRRAQRLPARRMATNRRSLRRERQAAANEAIPRESRSRDRRRLRRSHPHGPPRGEEPAELGRGVARHGPLGQARAGRLLEGQAFLEPQGHGLAFDYEGDRPLQVHGSGQRAQNALELDGEHRDRGADRPRRADRTLDAL